MKHILFTLLLHIITFCATSAQIIDDFSDGEIKNNPTWTGDVDNFKVNFGELQLNAPVGGSSVLFTPFVIGDSAQWDFEVRLDFSPSTSNKLTFFLQADKTDIKTANGYVLTMGENGDNDVFRLGKIKNGVSTIIASCKNKAILNTDVVSSRLRITRTKNGLWKIFADYNNAAYSLKEEASVVDNEFNKGNYFFGLQCLYTDTRKDKFFFDDIKVGEKEGLDVTPPILSKGEFGGLQNIWLYFNEVLDSTSAVNPANYSLDNGFGSPKSVEYQFSKLRLVYDIPFQNKTNYILTVKNVKDQFGNILLTKNVDLSLNVPDKATAGDILINEIMADPLPQVALPKAEYIELYNRSKKTIDLEGFTLKDKGITLYKLPKYTFLPDKYLIIYKREKGIDFGKYGDTIALASFFALDSDNENITLFDALGEKMDEVAYNLTTYRNPSKSDGGWSLERINPENYCLGGANFKASVNEDGGSPGKKNAVFSNDSDKTPLMLTYFFPLNDTTILLRFNKNLGWNLSEKFVSISTGLKGYIGILPTNSSAEIRLLLAKPMQKGQIYTLVLSDGFTDCLGNKLSTTTVTIGVAETIAARDVVVNEILFNPKTAGVDFIELYNRSKKIINLNDLNIDNSKNLDIQEIEQDYLLMPDAYVVLTEDIDVLSRQSYDLKKPSAVLQTKLPTFDDEEGNVTIYKADAPGKLIIDAVDYDKSYHYPLLKDQSGVSLERINPDGTSNDKNNWYSAASNVLATPTYKNSQFLIVKNTFQGFFSLENTRFSPDNDGFEDFLLLNYNTNSSGLTATIRVFDLEGRLVKTLINNELLSSEGVVRWDGDTDNVTKAAIGNYILLITYFTPDGTTNQEKLVFNLLGKF